MPSFEELKEQATERGQFGRLDFMTARADLIALAGMLAPDEYIEAIVRGKYNSRDGVCVATPRRVVFLGHSFLKFQSEDFGYDKITSVEVGSGVLQCKMRVHASGNSAEIDKVAVPLARAFAEAVRNKIQKQPIRAPDRDSGLAAELERLAALRQQGLLSDEEFQAAKKNLLHL